MTATDRLAKAGIVLPEAVNPIANYVTASRSGNLLFVSGHICRQDGKVVAGKLGSEHSIEDGARLARGTAIDILATVQGAVGSIDSVERVVKISGYVNSADDFTDQSLVINGASDLFVDVFGEEIGKHARAAIGVMQLPAGAAVELEAIFQVR